MDLDWLFEETQALPKVDQAQPPMVRLALDSLVLPEDKVLYEWIEVVFPAILDHLSLEGAKGLSAESTRALIPENVPKATADRIIASFERLDDQSMAIHLLNAALSGWTLVKLAGLSELEQKLYLAGVTLHDLNKIALEKLGELRMDGKNTEKYAKDFKSWGQKLNLWQFISEDYWQDVAFLAQNAEVSRGENRTMANYPEIKLTPGKLERLAPFVYFADLTASIAKRPEDLSSEKRAQHVVRRVLDGHYELRYHKTSENRGLLTQLIHNAVIEKAQELEWIPVLFFPTGITYLSPNNSGKLDTSTIPRLVRDALLSILKPRVSEFITPNRSGWHQGKQVNRDVLNIPDLSMICQAILSVTLNKNFDVKVGQRKEGLLKKFPHLKEQLDFDYPLMRQADVVAEAFAGIYQILCEAFKKRKANRECRIALRLIEGLELKEQSKDWLILEDPKLRSKYGGTAHSWYFIGGHFAKRHGDSLSDAELEQRLTKAVDSALSKIVKLYGVPQKIPFDFLENYVQQTLNPVDSNLDDFTKQLVQYEKNKAPKGNRISCAFCGRALDIDTEQMGYTHRRNLNFSKDSNKRGTCALCRLDQVLVGGSLDHKRTNVGEKRKDAIVYFHLYPNYFFTPETSRLMSRAYEDFAASRFDSIDRGLRDKNYAPEAIPRADVFRMLEDPTKGKDYSIERVEYPSNYLCGYHLLGLPFNDPKQSDANITDTETWTMPALLSLLVPLVLGTKVVASRSVIPPYDSGAEFVETVVVDDVHPYWKHSMRLTRFRLDQLQLAIPAVFSGYSIIHQSYSKKSNNEDQKILETRWNFLNDLSRKLAQDPLHIFGYADRIAAQASNSEGTLTQTDGMTVWLAERLIRFYENISQYYEWLQPSERNHMGLIKTTVDKYAKFYRAKGSSSAYARLRPLDDAFKVILASPTEETLDLESLKLQVTGRILSYLGRIRNKEQAITGTIPRGMWKDEVLIPAVEDFVNHVVDCVFREYAGGDRATLRKRINMFKNGCEAHYVMTYSKRKETPSTNHKENS